MSAKVTSETGVIYIATGEKYFQEACLNASRSKLHAEDLPFAILTDVNPSSSSEHVFDIHIKLEKCTYSYRDKILGLSTNVFKNFLFLDSDACLISPPYELITALDHFDICACEAPVKHPPGWSSPSVPSFFPEYNSGVILCKSSVKVGQFFQAWLSIYDSLLSSHNQAWDQATFRHCLWTYIKAESLKFYSLPVEYNLRTTKPWTASRGMPVYVVHGRYPNDEFSTFTSYLNSNIDCFRTWAHWISLYPNTLIRPKHDKTNYELF